MLLWPSPSNYGCPSLFEEKCIRRSCSELMPFHFFFQGCLCQILEHLGYPSDPQLERKRICREPVEIPAAREHLHVIYLRVYPLPLLPYPEPLQLLQPHQSHLLQLSQGWPFLFQNIESYAAHFRPLTASQSSLSQEMAAIRACQEQMLTTQAHHTAILRQLQHHLGLPSAAEHPTPTTAVPHSQATEPQAPPEAATEEAEPSA
ncbi:hypothetical protein CK203_056086 [Vitis vinifera]|uniref:Uncharacterized protein n=1 Tax=Vitis vinifera TaxID=29760 RepID=A0A438H4M3_VITVI|nr:hypothetical protein CK203_056086 [Vitis vinifera]